MVANIKGIVLNNTFNYSKSNGKHSDYAFKKKRIALAVIAGAFSTLSATFPQSVNANGSNIILHHDQEMTIDTEMDIRPTNVSSTGRVLIGFEEYIKEGSNGTLTVTENGILTARLINLARNPNSYAVMNVEKGGKVQVINTSYAYPMAIGGDGGTTNSVGAVGILNITGPGSEVIVTPLNQSLSLGSGEVSIGSNGATGYLNITDGGKFSVRDNDGTGRGVGIYIGSRGANTTKGYVTVDGTGSEFYAENRILVGTYNQGILTVTNGGTVKADSYISVGRVENIQGESLLSITGNNSLAQAENIYIGEGNKSQSAIVVADGGTLTSENNIHISRYAGSLGELIVGGRAGESALAAGTVNANIIQFGQGSFVGDGKITLNHTNDDYQLGAAIVGQGAINVLSGNTELTADNSGFTGKFTIENDGTLTAQQQQNLSNVAISNNGTLTLLGNSDWELINRISGNGLINVDTDNNQFSFADNTNSAFTGTVALNNTRFALDSLNAPQNLQFLQGTTLQLNHGSQATVGVGAQSIGGLTFNGGQLSFDSTITPGELLSSNWVETDANSVLDISGAGSVQVSMPSAVPNDIPVINGNKSLLEQDDEQTLVMLIKANGSVSGTGGQLDLIDENGNAISNAQLLDVSQNGSVVAKGTYDFQLSSGTNNDGLYIGYGLKQLELQGSGDNALILTPDAGSIGLATDLRAKLTGSGDLAIDAVSQTVSLSNGGNDYTGETFIRQGVLSLANNNVLGQTSHLQLDADTQVLMNNYQQSVGKLSTAVDSQVNLSDGSQLTITSAQRTVGDNYGGLIAQDTLVGTGSLILDSSAVVVNGTNEQYSGDVTLNNSSSIALDQVNGLGATGKITLTGADDKLTLSITPDSAVPTHAFTRTLAGQGVVSLQDSTDITPDADNSGFSGLFAVAQNSTLRAVSASQLGSASIDNQGELYLTANNSWVLENDIYGNGDLYKQGASMMIVNRDLTYTGNTTVEDGTLVIGDNTDSTGALSASAQVKVLSGAVLGGSGNVGGYIDNAGTVSALNALSGYESAAASHFTVGGLNNSGTILLAGGTTGNRLNINGNYAGNDGSQLIINTQLGDDSSVTDKLVISGDSAGATDLIVNNVNGAGAATQNGIQVVNVNGASNGEFKLANRAVAGAYEYLLYKNGTIAEDGHWYLRNTTEEQSGGEDNGNGAKPEEVTPDEGTSIYRPEAGSYIANMAAAKTMFNLRLEDREGRAENSSMWLRQSGSHNRQRESSGQLRTTTNSYVIQGGGEILSHQFGEQDRLGLGVMLGYGNASSKTRSTFTGYHSKGRVDGYTAGVYGTWYQDAKTLNGLYLDSWLQYSWLDASVNGEKLSQEDYDIKGYSASLEGGYRLPVYQGLNGNVFITPQAQVIFNALDINDYREAGGTDVRSSGKDNVQTRLGLKVSREGVHDKDKGTNKLFTIYAALNWLYNSELTGVYMNDVRLEQVGSRNIGELKLGAEGQINSHLNLWSNVAQQMGGDGYSDTSVNFGIKYRF
ncbi:autotransporter outer membrane beta-barrel domain-containing protein [Limnobaculum xujianqingii]|uniref:autotransporter outer membrane beta-barrel domain-containing protein n=1 Tax=Limnobaculum xujianqingii TaxID=2738837 RepID=UPI00112C95EA|nr:autotransporter outer membrane beta-barrel domain-containing protein [Limnobaculum xujianqingii]